MVIFDSFRIRERRGGSPTLGTRSRVDSQGFQPLSRRASLLPCPSRLYHSQSEHGGLTEQGRDRRHSPHSHECGSVEAHQRDAIERHDRCDNPGWPKG